MPGLFFPMGQVVNKIGILIYEKLIMYFIFLPLLGFPLVWWCIFVASKEKLSVETCKERTTTPVAAKFRDRRHHREPTHFLSGMKNVVRRLLGLWKLKNNVMEVPVLILNAMIILVFFNLLCFFRYLEKPTSVWNPWSKRKLLIIWNKWELLCILSVELILKWEPVYNFFFCHPRYGNVMSCVHFI